MGIRSGAAAIAIVAVATSGCIGETSRSAFETEVQARGGGIADAFVDELFTELARAVDADSIADVEVLSLNINPGSRSMTAEVRNPRNPDFVDRIILAQGSLVSSRPVQNVDASEIDNRAIRLGALPIDRLEELVDVALHDFASAGSFVDSVQVTTRAGEPKIRIGLDSDRETATAVFDLSGNLLELG